MFKERQRPTGCSRLAAAMQAARKRRGLSQQRVAELASGHCASDRPAATVSRGQVAIWESGHRRIPAPALDQIEHALNVRFVGVDRAESSKHHGKRWCRAWHGGVLQVVCRTRATVLYDDGGGL